MINISSIKTQMYCPMKLYIEEHMDKSENKDYQNVIEFKKLKIDVSDLIQKNMRKIKKEMDLDDIETALSQNITSYIESMAKTMDIETEKVDELINDTGFKIKIQALKLKQSMIINNKDANFLLEMFFPNCMYSYLLKDSQLELIGMCDKIEIADGKYYPITIKSSNPPLKGVWEQDAIELVANAILIEEEFDTEVFVGFVDYEKIGERRPVIMDVNLRKGLFDVIREVKEIIENKKLPNVKISKRKCEKCEYKNICRE